MTQQLREMRKKSSTQADHEYRSKEAKEMSDEYTRLADQEDELTQANKHLDDQIKAALQEEEEQNHMSEQMSVLYRENKEDLQRDLSRVNHCIREAMNKISGYK